MQVFRTEKGAKGVRPFFFGTPVSIKRTGDRDPAGYEAVIVEFAEGGSIVVMTDKPLIWSEPERQ